MEHSGGHDRAVAILDKIVKNVDVLVGNEEDLQMGLGIPGPDVHSKSKLDPSAFLSMMKNVTKKHPHVQVVATTLREVHSTNHHSWSAVAWVNGETHQAPTCELQVIDRVGGETDLREDSSTACYRGQMRLSRSSWVGPTGRCSRPSRVTPPWRPWIRSKLLLRADLPGFSVNLWQTNRKAIWP